MEPSAAFFSDFFTWVLRSGAQASILIALIILVRIATPQKHSMKLYSALWMLLIVKMVSPWAPESGLSVFNVLHTTHEPAAIETSQDVRFEFSVSPPSIDPELNEAAGLSPQSQARAIHALPTLSYFHAAVLGWLLVATSILAFVILKYAVFARRLKLEGRPADERMARLLNECKRAMRVTRSVDLLVTNMAPSPALLGFFKPKLLIPRAMLAELSPQEWRCIFLHELSHLKRHDIPLNWIATCLQALHWFNPLVWYAFRRMKADREIACDARALAAAGPDQSAQYAGAIVKLLKVYAKPGRLAGVAAILDNKSQLERRMNMIMRFNPAHQRWSLVPAFILCAVALVGLTDARTAIDDEAAQEESVTQAIKIEHANVRELVDALDTEFGDKADLISELDQPEDQGIQIDRLAQQTSGSTETVTRAIKIEHANVRELVDALDTEFGDKANISYSPRGGYIVATDTQINIEKIADLISELDQPEDQGIQIDHLAQQASGSTETEEPSALDEIVNIEFSGMDLRAVVNLLAKKAGLKVIEDVPLTGDVTVSEKEVPLRTALKRVLEQKGLAFKIEDQAIRIDNLVQQASDVEEISTQLIKVEHANIQEVVDTLDSVFGDKGNIAFNADSGSIIVSDKPENLEKIVALIRQLDKPSDEPQAEIQQKQISIEVMFVDAFMKDKGQRGNDWVDKVFRRNITHGGTLLPSSEISDVGMLRTDMDARKEIEAQVKAGTAELLSNPSLLTNENQQARIVIAMDIPYQELTQTTNGPPITTTAFKEVGTILEVEPHIASDGRIALDYTAEFSSLLEYNDSGFPIVDKSQRKGIAHLRNGQTFYIAGFRRLENEEGQVTELLMFITCKIVEPTS